MDIAHQMILFADVVEHGSFSAAARALGLTPSAVSKRIGDLEDRLGIRLLNRSTRQISLTEEGRAFHTCCVEISASVRSAEALGLSMGEQARGTLRVASTVAFGKSQVLPLLPEFLAQHGDVRVHLDMTDRPIDLSNASYDMAIRFSEQIEDDSLVARKLISNRRIICASPSYLAANGTPSEPHDLKTHNCLTVSTVEHWNDWHFEQDDQKFSLHVDGNFEASSADAVYHATLAGLGIARLSSYLVSEDLRTGRLVHLLPAHCVENSDILMVFSDRRNLSPRVRVFIDFLAAKFSEANRLKRPRRAQRLSAVP